MVTTHGITSAAGYYENTVRQKKDSTVKAKNNTASEQAVKSSEDKLSSKAKNYLDNLRKNYGDYDFIVADAGDDRRALLDKSDKEFSVIFSNSPDSTHFLFAISPPIPAPAAPASIYASIFL